MRSCWRSSDGRLLPRERVDGVLAQRWAAVSAWDETSASGHTPLGRGLTLPLRRQGPGTRSGQPPRRDGAEDLPGEPVGLAAAGAGGDDEGGGAFPHDPISWARMTRSRAQRTGRASSRAWRRSRASGEGSSTPRAASHAVSSSFQNGRGSRGTAAPTHCHQMTVETSARTAAGMPTTRTAPASRGKESVSVPVPVTSRRRVSRSERSRSGSGLRARSWMRSRAWRWARRKCGSGRRRGGLCGLATRRLDGSGP